MSGVFRGAPTSAAKPMESEASHTRPEGALLQLEGKKKKNKGKERHEEENLMMMPHAHGQVVLSLCDMPPPAP